MDRPVDTEKMLAYARHQTRIFWQSVNREFGLLTREEISHTLGVYPEEVDRMRAAGELIAVDLDPLGSPGFQLTGLRFPGFQLDEDHRPRPVIRELIQLGAGYRVDELNLSYWMCAPITYFREEPNRPVDHIDDPDAIVEAARLSWGVVW